MSNLLLSQGTYELLLTQNGEIILCQEGGRLLIRKCFFSLILTLRLNFCDEDHLVCLLPRTYVRTVDLQLNKVGVFPGKVY